MKKLTREVRQAMRKSGMTSEQIAGIDAALQPKTYKLKRAMIARITVGLNENPVVVVTRKLVFTLKGWKTRCGQAKHMNAVKASRVQLRSQVANTKAAAEKAIG